MEVSEYVDCLGAAIRTCGFAGEQRVSLGIWQEIHLLWL